jgi:hypothetical protein
MVNYKIMSGYLLKPTIAGVLSAIAHQFIAPRKEGKGHTKRLTRSALVGANTFLASILAEQYIYPNSPMIMRFFNIFGSQGVNVLIATVAASTQVLTHIYLPAMPRGGLFTNFLYNLGSTVIASQVTALGYFDNVGAGLVVV